LIEQLIGVRKIRGAVPWLLPESGTPGFVYNQRGIKQAAPCGNNEFD